MVLQHKAIASASPMDADPAEIAQALGELLSQTPEYRSFLDAFTAMNKDVSVQRLASEMRDHQMAIKWGQDADGQHAAELTHLELEWEDHSLVKQYRQTEGKVIAIFQVVDGIISQEAGLAFAINAQQGGCNCSR